MEGERSVTIATIGHQISTWFGIVGAILSFICACILIGMWFGPVKDLPLQVTTISAQQNKIDGKLDIFQIKYETMNGQVTAMLSEQGKLREDTKRLEVMLAQLSITAVLKTDFLEWKSELERRNKLEAPPLKRGAP